MTIQALKLLLLTLSLSSSTIKTIYSNNIALTSTQISISGFDTSSSITPTKSAEMICENLSTFENYYNETFPTANKLTATSIENLIPLFIEYKGEQIEGILIDLNDDNGYITVGYDYQIFDIQGIGNQPFYNYPNCKYFYSLTNGYSYYNNAVNDWLSVTSENNSEEKDWDNIELNTRTYKGQEEGQTGNGKIKSPDEYIHDKYDSNYSLDACNSLDMDAFTQYKLSAYHSIQMDDQEYSEGNCWMVSAFHVLQYLAKIKFTNMYNDKDIRIGYTAKDEEPNIYSKYFDSNDKSKETITINKKVKDKWKLTNYSFPKLYCDVRHFAEKKYKKCESGFTWQTANIVTQIANQYNHTISYSNHYNWGSYVNYVKNKIDSNIPCIWSTSNDTYGAHSMAVCGYRYYKKTTRFWFFSYSTYKLLYELRDGHTADIRFYDISGHIGFSCLTFFDL